MHSDQPYLAGKPMLPFGDQVGYYMHNAPISSVSNGFAPPWINPLTPLGNLDVQPSAACPRNFIIFDQTNNRSQVMFHPEISSKLFYPGFGVETSIFQGNVEKNDANDKIAPLSKEDSDDIDALLSTEYEESEESEDEVMSSARTNAIYACNSPDSCSNYESVSVSRKSRSIFKKSCGARENREKMREMVKALRGIVPGANRMSTVAVLDEAVRYLKSLRVQVQKLGVGNSKG